MRLKHNGQVRINQIGTMADDNDLDLKKLPVAKYQGDGSDGKRSEESPAPPAEAKSTVMGDDNNDGWGKDRTKNPRVIKAKGSWKYRRGPITTPLKFIPDDKLFCIDRNGKGIDSRKEATTDPAHDPVSGTKRGRKGAEHAQAKGEEDADCKKRA